MEAIRRENGAVLKENSLLHMELIKKDETCNEKVRRALAEMHKLESTVSELIFWKEQASHVTSSSRSGMMMRKID